MVTGAREGSAAAEETESPAAILCAVAPVLVPVLYEIGERTWPSQVEVSEKKWGAFGPAQKRRVKVGNAFRVLLRRFDLATLSVNWRLEAAGPVEFFEWDGSGEVLGSYGIRYTAYTVAPVFDERGQWTGFGLNCRSTGIPGDRLTAVDARVSCAAYVRSKDPADVASGLRNLAGAPRSEEFRPGLDPTDEYFQVVRFENKQTYFDQRGVNQYAPPGWTPESLQQILRDPSVRALWIAHPDRVSATPKPQLH